MTRKTRKRVFRFILLPIIIFILLIVTAVAVLFSQQQRLVKLAVTELNKQLPGELVVGGSEISVFQNFPYISIGLKQVQFYGNKVITEKPIYEAERMYIGFSLPDILKQQYHVKVILLKNGRLDLIQDTAGMLNIVEASRMAPDTSKTVAAGTKDLDLDIKKFVLKGMNITFLDKQNGHRVAANIERIQASFKDDGKLLNTSLQGKLMVDYTRPGDTVLFRHKHLETDIRLSYDMHNKKLELPLAQLKLEDAVFNVTGTVDLLHGNTADLRFSGDKPDFRQLFAFAPESIGKELKHFKYDGKLDFKGTVKGALSGGHQPLIELSFACTNAWLHNTEADKKLDSLSFKGFYTNGADHNLKTSELRLMDMSARPDKGLFKGNFIMRDFSDPKVLMQINSELELGFIGAFLGIKDLQRITGHISLKMNFKELMDLSVPEQSMGKLTEGIQSELTVTNLTFRVPSYPYLIEHLDLHADMKNGFLKLDSLSCNIGNSDFHMNGSLSDLPALFHHQEKPVQLAFHASSKKIVLKELLAFDSARSNKAKEEIYGFNIGLSLETSVNELLHPQPLPRGKFRLEDLNAAFKNYPHVFHDFGAELAINDTSVLLRNFAGKIDSSDLRFSGRVNNYALWFDKVKHGRTQLAFDLRSQHLAMKDLLGRRSRQYVPQDYQREVGSNIWLRSKWDLRYDTVFKFANIRIANISGQLTNHAFTLDSISGNVKFGTDNFVRIDTLKGKIGNSDFNLSMRLYTGKDTNRMKKENFLSFSSRFLDVDQLSNYKLTEADDAAATQAIADPATVSTTSVTAPASTQATTAAIPATTASKPVSHTDGYNVFSIPFINFNANVSIGKMKYRRLWPKNLFTNLRMQANQQLYLDTFRVDLAGGNIAARAHFNGSDPNKIYLRSRINVKDVNLEKLLLKMDYLGQDYVINKNIKGTLSGQIKSYVKVHPDLTPMIDESDAEVKVEIRNGMLMNFTPMQAMSSYFGDKNLMMVRFDTLRNTLTFKSGALSIPSMNINSSLGFIEISGQQALDMKMEYYLRIPLKLVTQAGFHKLFGKKQEEVDPDQVDAIEYRDKDKRVRFMNIKISGTPDNFKVGLGKAKSPKAG